MSLSKFSRVENNVYGTSSIFVFFRVIAYEHSSFTPIDLDTDVERTLHIVGPELPVYYYKRVYNPLLSLNYTEALAAWGSLHIQRHPISKRLYDEHPCIEAHYYYPTPPSRFAKNPELDERIFINKINDIFRISWLRIDICFPTADALSKFELAIRKFQFFYRLFYKVRYYSHREPLLQLLNRLGGDKNLAFVMVEYIYLQKPKSLRELMDSYRTIKNIRDRRSNANAIQV